LAQAHATLFGQTKSANTAYGADIIYYRQDCTHNQILKTNSQKYISKPMKADNPEGWWPEDELKAERVIRSSKS